MVDNHTTNSALEVEISLGAIRPPGDDSSFLVFGARAYLQIQSNLQFHSLDHRADICFREALHAYKYMVGHARLYKKRVQGNSRLSHADALVCFYAADCMLRLDAFRDKLALAVMALYMIFDPDKKVRGLRETLQVPGEVMKCGRPQDRYLELFRTELGRLHGREFQLV